MTEQTILAARNGIAVSADANNVVIKETDVDGKEAATVSFDRRDAKAVAKAIVEASKSKPLTE